MGSVFGIGLILTLFAGAELFTGYVMYLGFGFAKGCVGMADIVRVSSLVWLGNLAGALAVTVLFVAGGGGTVFASGGELLHGYVSHKVDATAVALLARALLCNWLVCLAIWTSSRVQGDTAKCIVLAWVLLAFVGTGFEHSVANMTALGLGLLVSDATVSFTGVLRKLLLVTAGNVLGGLLPVVGAYLVAARTDERGGPAMHDAGPLPTALRSPPALAAE
jgi:nitrite transporter NirC